MSEAPRVFVAFAREGTERLHELVALVERLRGDGFEVVAEAPVGEAGSYQHVVAEALESRRPLLLFITPGFREDFEGWKAHKYASVAALVAYDAFHGVGLSSELLVPVLPPGTGADELPLALRQHRSFRIPEQYVELRERLGALQPHAHDPDNKAGGSIEDQLVQFLSYRLRVWELRNLALRLPDGREILSSLPENPASMEEFSRALVLACARREQGLRALIAALQNELPFLADHLEPLRSAHSELGLEDFVEASGPFSRLVRTLELSIGFELFPVVMQDAALVAGLLGALREAGWAVEAKTLGGDDWLGLLPWLESREATGVERRLVLIHGVAWDSEPFRSGLHALNVRREPLIRALACPLLWCGSREFQAASQLAMPDLWSVRAVPQRIVGAGTAGALPLRLLRPAAEGSLPTLRRLARSGEGSPNYVLALVRSLLREASPDSLQEAHAAIATCLANRQGYGGLPVTDLRLLDARAGFELHDLRALEELPKITGASPFQDGQILLLTALRFALAEQRWQAAHLRSAGAIDALIGAGAPRELVSARLLHAAIVERMGDREEALRNVEQALAEARAAGQPETEADVLLAMGLLARAGGDLKRADELFTASAERYRGAQLESQAQEVESHRFGAAAH